MNISYRDRGPKIPVGCSNPITDATVRRRSAPDPTMVPTDYLVARWFIAVGLRYPYGETGRNGGIGGGPIPSNTTRCGAVK
jgi:hypothetical protein